MSVRRSGRPGWAALLLAVCLLAVGFHFVGESFVDAAASPLDSLHPGHDLAEDQFILASSAAPSAASGGLWGASPLLPFAARAGFAPPVPPPDN